jgi:PadR family transcriptional regulator, regulatory protein AphA
MVGRLTTTSYCLLGLLHLGPSSAYELTKYMQRSALASLWPRTEAAVYRETRRLADAGLAEVTVEHNGDRSRSVYRITAVGRRALRTWLDEPGTGLRFECEAAVKAFFADAADLDSMRAQLAALVEEFDDLSRRMEPVSAGWLAGELRFPNRIHYTAMSADLIARLQLVIQQWATDWLERTGRWDGTGIDDAKRTEAHEVITRLRATIADRVVN